MSRALLALAKTYLDRALLPARPVPRVLAGLLLTGLCTTCTSYEDPPSGIFYSNDRLAAADLSRFEHDNPQCQLWSNWQNKCSRTGENGAVLCRAAERPVRPSAPFCLAEADDPYKGPAADAPDREFHSFLRFCRLPEGASASRADWTACLWQPSRPFGGHRKAELDNPWCTRWRRNVGPSGGYYCSSRSLPEWCIWPEGLGYGEQDDDDDHAPGEEIILASPLNPDSVPVHGVYCRRRTAAAPTTDSEPL